MLGSILNKSNDIKQKTNIKDKVKDFFINDIPEPLTTYHITPDPTISNKDNVTLANAISNMYKAPKDRIASLNLKTTQIVKSKKCYWDIVFQKGKSDFYITVHDDFKELIVNKAKTIWNRTKIGEVNDLTEIDHKTNGNVCVGELILKTYNFKSLNTDLSNQYPLTNMVSIIKALKDNEFVRVNVAIEPINRMNWIAQAKDDMARFRKGEILNNEIGLKEQLVKLGVNGIETALDLYIEFRMMLVESIFGIFYQQDETGIGSKKQKRNSDRESRRWDIDLDEFDSNDRITSSYNRNKSTSNYKSTAEAYKIKLTIISKGENGDRARLSLLAVAGAFKDLTDDNELTLRLYDEKQKNNHIDAVSKLSVSTNKKCIVCDKELAKLMQLPQKTIQSEYKLNVIDTRESELPKQLQGGNVRICEVDEPSNNRKIMATFPMETNLLARKTVLLGGENSGKTTQLKRFSKDFYKAGITNFVIDHQENGKLTDEISSAIPDKDRVIYDVYNEMPPLAFVEVSKLIKEDMDRMTRLDYANMIAKQVELFVNSITDESTGTLTGRMKRFLHSACMIVFIKPQTTINDVFNVLNSWKIRNEFLKYARYSKLFDEDDDVFVDMEELHKREKGEGSKIIGTRDDLIVGITNRVTIIKQNPRIKEMLKKQYDESDDFDKYIQSGKSIFIKIPQNKFPDDDTRDMLAVFYFSRLWLTVQIREENKDSKLCHCVLDEIKALPTLAMFMEKHITEFRRHRLALTISCHGLLQFGKLLTQLKDSGANFIIMPPVDKKNIEMLKEEIAPFEMDDVLSLKPHHGLCVINYGNQYAKFIGKMPKD